MITVIRPSQYKTTNYLTATCNECEAILRLDEGDRRSDLVDNGILCPECGGFISQFTSHKVKKLVDVSDTLL